MQSRAALPVTDADAHPLSDIDLSADRPAMRILRLKQVQALVGLCRATIYQRKREGTFPQTVKLGTRAVGWIADDVLAWIAQQANRPAPSPGHASEERSRFRGDLKCEAASKRQEDRIDEPRDGYRLRRYEYEELQRLRGIERRFRQITQLQAEIAALIQVSMPDKGAVSRDDE
jgi:prophage regulatory protein